MLKLLFILLIAVPLALLMAWAIRVHGPVYEFSLLLFYMVSGIIAYKKGFIRHGPRRRSFTYPVASGLITGFAVMAVWRVLTGPLPQYTLLIFVLIVVFATFLSDKIWKRLGVY